MRNENKKQKESEQRIKTGLKDNAPLFWNSYQNMYEARERLILNKINFLLLVATFLPILSITLYTTPKFKDMIILVPIVFQFVALLILLKDFFSREPMVHWFEIKETIKKIAKDNFHEDFFCNLKALEELTWENMMVKYTKIIKPALHLIILSLFVLSLSMISIVLNLSAFSYLLILVLFCSFHLFILFYYAPEKTKKENTEKYKIQLERIIREIKEEFKDERN